MPSQAQIIDTVNRILKQIPHIKIELNKGGVCAGLAGLYIKYALEKKTDQYFRILEKLAHLPKDYKFGKNTYLDDFVIQIEKTFNQPLYSNYKYGQSDIEKILSIKMKPLANEFNIGLVTNEAQWENILSQIARPNRAYQVYSTNHAIALSFNNGQYEVCDSNYNHPTKTFKSVKEVIQEFKDCFGYEGPNLGLSIRVFAHPDDKPITDYPRTLHESVLATEEAKKQTITVNGKTSDSASFASDARDSATLEFLLNTKAFDPSVSWAALLNPQFVELLLKQPKSESIKKALEKIITIHLFFNVSMIERVIRHYRSQYTSVKEIAEFKLSLTSILEHLNAPSTRLTTSNKLDDFSYFLQICDEFKLLEEKNPTLTTNYYHLKLLTLCHHKESALKIDQFLATLKPAQILEQIKLAARLNQHVVLDALILSLGTAKIEPGKIPSIFNEELVQYINHDTLKRIIDSGFLVAPNLLSQCFLHNDKAVFELYARTVINQSNQKELLHVIDTFAPKGPDLSTKIGDSNLLITLVLLNKRTTIERLWKDDIDTDIIKSALVSSISAGNKEISSFLYKKLQSKKGQFAEEADYLYQNALKTENLDILSILAELGFNILKDMKDVPQIIQMCIGADDYSAIRNSYLSASVPMKKFILERGIRANDTQIIDLCANLTKPLFATLMMDWINKSDSPERSSFLQKINFRCNEAKEAQLKLLRVAALKTAEEADLKAAKEAQIVSVNFNEIIDQVKKEFVKKKRPEQKSFIEYCYLKGFAIIADNLATDLIWTREELSALLNQLIHARVEERISALLTQYSALVTPGLIQELLKNRLFNVVHKLLSQNKIPNPDFYSKIFEAAITHYQPALVKTILDKALITPQTRLTTPLTQLLKQAIQRGNNGVIEPFITSKVDFKIDFKELFFHSCEQAHPAVANQLLERPIKIAREEMPKVMPLFGSKTPAAIFDWIYTAGFGRLYTLLMENKIPNHSNPRAALLNSIKQPISDPKFAQTAFGLTLLDRALKSQNPTQLVTLSNQANWPKNLSEAYFNFLKQHCANPKILSMFTKQYGEIIVLNKAITQKEWGVVAFVLEAHAENNLPKKISDLINANKQDIIEGYIAKLAYQYTETDVRPRLFNLIDPYAPSNELTRLANSESKMIHEIIGRIELSMISGALDLNGKVYRHSTNLQPFNTALAELSLVFQACAATIQSKKIDLRVKTDNKELINHFIKIKELMVNHDINPYYIQEDEQTLLEQLTQNPTFATAFEMERKVYGLIKQMNLDKYPLGSRLKADQNAFNRILSDLSNELKTKSLGNDFVPTKIRSYLSAYQEMQAKADVARLLATGSTSIIPVASNRATLIQGLIHTVNAYINQRKNESFTHHWLSFFQFNIEEKLKAAVHFIQALQNPDYLINDEDRAILSDGRLASTINDYLHINQEAFQTRFNSNNPIKSVDDLIDKLNQQEPITKLIKLLEEYQKQRSEKAEIYHFALFTQYTKTDKLNAVTHLIDALKSNCAPFTEKELGALNQGSLGELISEFITTYGISLEKTYNTKINNLNDLIKASTKNNDFNN